MSRSRRERALEHYFSPGNLTALRELALRRTAERVDEQLLTHMQAHAISGPWAAGERVLVCVSEDPRAAGLVRYAKRVADRLHAPWTALYVETPRTLQLDRRQRDRIADTLRLAESARRRGGHHSGRRAGSPTRSSPMPRANNVTQIVIGKSTRSRWFEILYGSVVHELVRRSGNISVHVIAGDEIAASRCRARRCAQPGQAEAFDPWPYLVAPLAVAAALGVGAARPPVARHRECRPRLPDGDLSQSRCAIGLWPSLFASVASVALLQLLLPAAALHLHDRRPEQRRRASSSSLSSRSSSRNLAGAGARAGGDGAQRGRRRPKTLYVFSRKLAGVGTLDDVLWATAFQIASMLKVRVVLLLPENGSIAVQGRLSARGHARRGRPRGREMGLGEQPAGRARLRHAAGRQAAVPADAHRPRRDRRRRHRQRQAGTAAHAGAAPPARRADRPGGAGDRARRTWSRTSTGPGVRSRPTACARRCSPRSRTISRRRSRRSSAPQAALKDLCRQALRRARRPICSPRSSRSRSGSTASSPTCST